RGNMFNKNDIERSVALDTATGEKKEVANQNISHEIKVGGGVGLFLKYISGISCFNKNDEFLSGWSTNGQEVTYTTPPETEYIKVNVNNYNLDIAMVYIGDTIKDYEPFSVKILGHDITGNIEIENSKESNNVFSPEDFDVNFKVSDMLYESLGIQDIYNGFDELISKYPDYITRQNHGLDDTGEYNVYEYRLKPQEFDYNEEGKFGGKLSKVVFVSNSHGFERTS